jgi:membrane associated rhomboid family serine protease
MGYTQGEKWLRSGSFCPGAGQGGRCYYGRPMEQPAAQQEVIRAAPVEVLDRYGRPVAPSPPEREPGAPASLALVGLCVLVYALFNIPRGGPPIEYAYAPAAGQVFPQLLTSIFVHGSFLHLLGNGMVIFTLGSGVEPIYGSWRYTLIFLATGVLSALIQGWLTPEAWLIGASGAASAIMVMFVRHYPRATLLVFFVPMPAWIFMLLWIAFNVAGQQFGFGGQIAFIAHLAGLVVGLVLVLLALPPRRLRR